jgi:hypothetical protein
MNETIKDSYFMNKHHYCKIKKKEDDKIIKRRKKEVKFYKKRIYKLIKDIIDNKEFNEELNKIMNIFIDKSIQYLKMKDRTSLIQQDYKNLNIEKKMVNDEKKIVNDENSKSQVINKSNILLFKRSETKINTIEKSFGIKKKKTTNLLIPKQKNLDLKDPKFKKNN